MSNETASAGVIKIRLQKLSQLFNSFDPSPFNSRDLDDDAEEFIAGWAAELPKNQALEIVLHLPPDEAGQAEQLHIPQRVSQYFGDRADVFERQIRELFRIGWRHLGVGLFVLLTCLSLSQLVHSLTDVQPLARIIEESLIIVGWVANWKPIEIFLYEWWPIKRRIRLYRRLQRARIVIHPDDAVQIDRLD